MLKKIISGGQTGADQGGLEIGKELGLETGGTAPYNWATDEGPNRPLLESYGLKAGPHDPRTFPIRTEANVQNSDGTALFGDCTSPGSRLTIKYCEALGKPFCTNPQPLELANWLVIKRVEVLNVAGNRERKNPGIKEKTKQTIKEAELLMRMERRLRIPEVD
jgi:hypothetical protein